MIRGGEMKAGHKRGTGENLKLSMHKRSHGRPYSSLQPRQRTLTASASLKDLKRPVNFQTVAQKGIRIQRPTLRLKSTARRELIPIPGFEQEKFAKRDRTLLIRTSYKRPALGTHFTQLLLFEVSVDLFTGIEGESFCATSATAISHHCCYNQFQVIFRGDQVLS